MRKNKGCFRRIATRFGLHADALRLAKRFLLVFLFILSLLILSAFLAWVFEFRGSEDSTIRSFWDGIWWAVVTIATVGYGDKFPVTYPGRVVGLILISVGFTSLSVFTGLIASLFIEDKLKGAKGLKQIRTHNHVVICGWNNTGDFFLRALIEKQLQDTDVCILANETPEFFESLEAKYPSLSLSYVRGEATQEESLKRAAVEHAAQVIILADHALAISAADDRSIIVANAVHYLVKKEKITVQLINTENRNMLQRIGISNIIIWDDIGGYILANNVFENNSLSIFSHLAKDPHKLITTIKVGDGFIGKSFGEYFDFLYQEQGKLIIGLMNKEPELESSVIFADDSTGIDQFIKAALAKSKRLLQEDKSNIRWNPSRDSIILTNDFAILIA
ncbi:MAG: potassium channel family protein [Candidatus Cloacimonetes bacterium]|nr:potassium channel family protein [Candidatus Cloacimonadota bacterium]